MTAGDVYVVKGSTHAKQSVMFDGTDDYILADAHAVARVAANDTVGTYSAWIYKDNISSTGTILSVGDNDNTNEYFTFSIALGGVLRIFLKHGGATKFDVIETTGSIPAKKWTHVAVVQDGTQPKLYVNGVASATTNTTAVDLTYWYDKLTLVDKFAIGVQESNNTHTLDFAGMICQVRYWNKALTPSQILTDSNGATADPAVTAALKLDLPLQTDMLDDSGEGDTGSLTGQAYLAGWASEWSREIELHALVADDLQTTEYPGGAMTTILKAA